MACSLICLTEYFPTPNNIRMRRPARTVAVTTPRRAEYESTSTSTVAADERRKV